MNFVPSKDSNLACLSNSDWREEIFSPKLLYEHVIQQRGVPTLMKLCLHGVIGWFCACCVSNIITEQE